ncbi:acyl-coenzyme A thioesterase 9, mitochondrial isoform 2-T2 [Sylvia borin]
MLPTRLCIMRKLPSVLARTLTSGTSASPGLPDMSKGQSPIHVNNVRSELRDIVGASTNWRDHVQAMQERKALHTLLAKRQEDLPPRRMKDSYLEVILPLGSQPEIREKYLNVHNSVRFGRILEDLDSLGVLICYTHTKQEMQQRSPLSIVTALVDKINLCQKIIRPDCDIKFTGNVSWVGKTSMEVKMHMLQLHDGDYSPVLDATFVMVARDPENKRPAFVNPLIPESPEEEEIFKQGELNKLKRIEFSTASLLKMAPTAEERNIVHDIFLNTLDTRTVSFHSRKLPPNSVWMEDAKLKGLQICHPEERNIFNRIFGGFLMRKAFELGWATACSYGNFSFASLGVPDPLSCLLMISCFRSQLKLDPYYCFLVRSVTQKKNTSRFEYTVKFTMKIPGSTILPIFSILPLYQKMKSHKLYLRHMESPCCF